MAVHATQFNSYQYQSPYLRWMGYAVWLCMFVMSIVFYKERATFMDGGFQLFDLINTERPSIHHYRLTNPLTQVLPLIGIKVGLSLKAVMVLYSINFIAFQAGLYTLIVRWCKNDFLGLVQIMFFTMMVTQSFYFLTPEYYQGMSILLLWFAILLRFPMGSHIWVMPMLALMVIPILFDHALLSVFFLLMWLFFWFHDASLRTKRYYGLLAWMVVVYLLKSKYLVSWYDKDRQKHFWNHLDKYGEDLLGIPAHKAFAEQCLSIYYWFPVLLLIVSVVYIYQVTKKNSKVQYPLLKLGLIIGFCCCYLMVNHINDPKVPFIHYSQVNYIGLMIPLGLAICVDILPLAFDGGQSDGRRKIVIAALGFILISRLAIISSTHQVLKDRQEWIVDRLSQSERSKQIAKTKHVPKDKLIQIWSIPEESMLLTALEGPDQARTLTVVTSVKKYEQFLNSTDTIIRFYSEMPQSALNKHYFDFPNETYLDDE